MQEILRTLAAEERLEAKVDLAKRLLRQLPATNWFARNPAIADHLQAGDAGLCDLLLHSRDRAFTVPDLADLVRGAGLEIVTFIEPWRYDPASYLNDGALLKRLAGLDALERARVAELLAGNLKTHICYLVRAGRAAAAVARIDDPGLAPVLRQGDGASLAKNLKPGGALTVRIDGIEARFALPRRAGPILALIDGRRDLADIHRTLATADLGRLDWPTFKEEFDRLYIVFNRVNRLFLQQCSSERGQAAAS
jgi:hypothetical protein